MQKLYTVFPLAGNINHSERVMRVITWNRSFRGLPNNTDDGLDDFDSEEHETHATVLDKMLAWEKKLYDEVKVTSFFHLGSSFVLMLLFKYINELLSLVYVLFILVLIIIIHYHLQRYFLERKYFDVQLLV